MCLIVVRHVNESDDNDWLCSPPQRSRLWTRLHAIVHVFWRSGIGGVWRKGLGFFFGCIVFKSSLLLLVSPASPTLPLRKTWNLNCGTDLHISLYANTMTIKAFKFKTYPASRFARWSRQSLRSSGTLKIKQQRCPS